MTVEERIEANANLALWCVHVIGPDDLYAEPSHAAAVANAEKLNRAVLGRSDTPGDVMCFAYADTWPWSAEAHAKDIERQKLENESQRGTFAATTK